MFYDKFKLLCSQSGISCNKAATDIGLSNSTPTKWKKTGAPPDGATLAKISAYFKVPISSLLTDDSTGALEFTTSIQELRSQLGNSEKEKSPSITGAGSDRDIRRIERAREKMTDTDKDKMMKLLELSFSDYFSDDYEDDDLNE